MPFKKDGNLSFTVKEDGINEVIDEKGNLTLMLREVSWGNREAHLELRRWIIDIDKETPMKGCAFLTEEGPNTLVNVMVKNGFGDTNTILHELSSRDDFEESLIKTIGKTKIEKAKESEITISEDDYFDPKAILDD